METPILILEDSLIQQRQYLQRWEKDYKVRKFQNEKQKAFFEKAIDNTKRYVAEIESAIKILKSIKHDKKCKKCFDQGYYIDDKTGLRYNCPCHY